MSDCPSAPDSPIRSGRIVRWTGAPGANVADRERGRLQSRRQRDQASSAADTFGNAVQRVVFADEARDERRRRLVVETVRRSDLSDVPAFEYRHAIRHRQRFALVVRHIDDGDAEHLVDLLQLDLHVLAQLLVERAERFVHQNERRLETPARARARRAAAGRLKAGRACGP